MDYTELYQQSGALVAFSSGAHWVANAIHDRLVVRRADTFQITRAWHVDVSPSPSNASFVASTNRHSPAAQLSSSSTDALVSHIAWSADSEYLLAACARHGVVNIYKMRDEDWSARIEAGVEGLVRAEWAPDGRNILCFSEWGLRVTVWSLVTGVATHIQFPKHPDRGYAFRRDGRYFVLAERHRSKDMLGVYDAGDSYKQARHYTVPTSSLASLAISPTGKHIAVWEGPLEFKLCILSLPGTLLSTYIPQPDTGLGIRCVAWHPSGSFIAVGGYDDKIHILDGLSWSCVVTLELASRIPTRVTVWREPSNWIEATLGRGYLSYERPQGTQSIIVNRADASKAYPKSGLVQLEWNANGSLLVARYESAPTALFIYAFPAPSERFKPCLRSVLLHTKPVIRARWNPIRSGALVLSCGGGGLYTWSNEWSSSDTDQGVNENEDEEIAECIGIPAKNFQLRDVRWAPDGKGLLLIDKDVFCCAFEVEDDEDETGGA
ncbi:hypothetical protein EW145_g995 [Phellinidium pouzarii]|uniref:Anaphase-promoting complex subunit 4 WD40 domain-containing protein n=1 Tax=Phellinidium pouzarii TaxID=167371 RepID=A0A4S4LGE4_9AGAM|nr:hypothetical protein EW145_g995 [Phellinidium pouzarii]